MIFSFVVEISKSCKQHSTQHIWGRTVDSMLIEWDAHNDVHKFAILVSEKHAYRVAHTDFDYNDEKTAYWEFWERTVDQLG